MGRKRPASSREGTDERLMRECLRLARLGEGRVSPNPMVGAILVRGGRILSRGFHRRYGGPHAEVDCLARYRGDPSGATLYVNLEPCVHHGKTPPCTDRIITSRIAEVVIAMGDPNPLVSGRGVRRLRDAGIRVRSGVLQREAAALNEEFIVGITERRPFVHLKLAQSKDGFITDGSRNETRISGRPARTLVHRWRSRTDAVLVGAGTIRIDNPELSVRHVRGRDPAVVILDGRLSVSPEARVFRSARRRKVFVVTRAGADHRTVRDLSRRGVQVVQFASRTMRLPMRRVLQTLYSLEIGSLLVEGGGDVARQLVAEGLVDRVSLFVAPVAFGDGVEGLGAGASRKILKGGKPRKERVGRDLLLTYDRKVRVAG